MKNNNQFKMSFQVQKKISVPCEKHLQNEKIKKRRSKMFIQANNTTDSSLSLDTSGEVNPNYDGIIRQDLFSDYNSQVSFCGAQRNDVGPVSIFDNIGVNIDTACIMNGTTSDHILSQILIDLDKNEDDVKCKSQPVNQFVALRSKAKRMDFSQRFGDAGNRIDGFRYKRTKIGY